MTPKQLGYEPQAWAGIMVMAWALIVVCIFFAGYVYRDFITMYGGY